MPGVPPCSDEFVRGFVAVKTGESPVRVDEFTTIDQSDSAYQCSRDSTPLGRELAEAHTGRRVSAILDLHATRLVSDSRSRGR